MNLVYSLIAREYPTYIQDEDIIQCGMLGLCMAADKWEEGKAKFSAFAWFCIRHEIIRELKKRSKHQGVLSLDSVVRSGESEGSTFVEFVVGDEDVAYVDTDTTPWEERLTPKQKEIIELLKQGKTPHEVAEIVGCTNQYVYLTRRQIRLLRSKANG
jgi:DNA-directed RNA polymerase